MHPRALPGRPASSTKRVLSARDEPWCRPVRQTGPVRLWRIRSLAGHPPCRDGCGPWSATVSVSVSIIPAVPGDLRVTVLSPPYKGRYTVTWGGVAGATRYEVKLQSPNELDYPYSGADTTFTSILLNTTGSVEFWVRACNANGCSDWSLSTSEQFSSQ